MGEGFVAMGGLSGVSVIEISTTGVGQLGVRGGTLPRAGARLGTDSGFPLSVLM